VSSRTKLSVVGAAMVLSACTDISTPLSTPSRVETPRAAVAGTAAVCDFTQLRTDARRFFRSPTDPGIKLIGFLQEASRTPPATRTIEPAFDIIKRVSEVLGTLDQRGTAAVGEAFVRGVFACTPITVQATTFSLSDALGPGGMFSVRGNDAKDGLTNPVLSRLDPNFDPWVVEPFFDTRTSTWKTWGQSSGGQRFLIYGSKIPPFTPETPVPRTSFFEIKTIPDITFSPPLVVGVCTTNSLGRLRVQHETSILSLTPPQHCLGNNPAQGVSIQVGRAFEFFGGVGGRPSDFSPFALIDAVSIALTFVTQPTNGRADQVIEPFVRVQAMSSKGTPVEGVSVTLRLNGATGEYRVLGATAVTGVDGIAIFRRLSVGPAGTYSLTATGTLSGFNSPTATSVTFVRN
jgi:hypothetical protein